MPTLVNNLRAIRGPVTAVPVVGQSGVVVEPDTQNNQVVVRADETVLWEGEFKYGDNAINFNESIANFEYIRIINGVGEVFDFKDAGYGMFVFGGVINDLTANIKFFSVCTSYTSTTLTYNYNRVNQSTYTYSNVSDTPTKIVKIVGYNRIANN